MRVPTDELLGEFAQALMVALLGMLLVLVACLAVAVLATAARRRHLARARINRRSASPWLYVGRREREADAVFVVSAGGVERLEALVGLKLEHRCWGPGAAVERLAEALLLHAHPLRAVGRREVRSLARLLRELPEGEGFVLEAGELLSRRRRHRPHLPRLRGRRLTDPSVVSRDASPVVGRQRPPR